MGYKRQNRRVFYQKKNVIFIHVAKLKHATVPIKQLTTIRIEWKELKFEKAIEQVKAVKK